MNEAETVIRKVMLEGEELLWSGQPDWSNLPRPTRLKDRLKALGMFLMAGATAVILVTWGLRASLEGFAAMLVILGVALSGIILFVSFNRLLNPGTLSLDEEYYGLTDRRLICISRSNWRRTSVMKGFVAGLECVAVGNRFDVNVALTLDPGDAGDFEYNTVGIRLRAVPDGPEVEKLLLETLIPVEPGDGLFPDKPKEERLQ